MRHDSNIVIMAQGVPVQKREYGQKLMVLGRRRFWRKKRAVVQLSRARAPPYGKSGARDVPSAQN